MTQTPRILAALLATIVLAGPAGAQGMHHGHGGHAPSSADTPATQAYKAADAQMMRDMAVPYTGDADVDFRTHMIPHHQGAVAMAKVALAHAKDPATKAMAQKIVDDQETEIGELKAWLKAHAGAATLR